MNKPLTEGKKKASTATDKAKKKPGSKIGKGGKVKTKKTNTSSSSIVEESTIPSDIALSTKESWSLTESIRQFVRMEVEDALMKTSIKRHYAFEASQKEKIVQSNEYVKREDLNDIVNKLISQHTESIIKKNSEDIMDMAGKVLFLEETLKNLTARMESVEDSVREMRKGFLPTTDGSQRVERVTGITKPAVRFQLPNKKPFNNELSNNKLPFVSRSMPRLSSVSQIRLAAGSLQEKAFSTKNSVDSDDDSTDLESNPSSTEINNDKSRLYYEAIRKLSPKSERKQSDLSSTWSPSKLDVNPSLSSVEKDWMTDRSQIYTNMLRYQKSPLTLQLDSQKNYFPNEEPKLAPKPNFFAKDGPNTSPGLLTRRPPPRPVHPRLSRPRMTKSTEEAQSDWLFEQ